MVELDALRRPAGQLARATKPEQPTALLISSRLYDATVERYCQSPGRFGNRQGAEPTFATLRQKLFGHDRR